MRVFKGLFLLRLAVAIILLSHSLHGVFTGTDVHDFGELLLNKIGFAPFGVPLAWAVVLGQVLTALLLLLNRWLRPAAAFNIVVLLVGIATVHWPEGWFVVGGGRNGMEFSFLLIACLLSISLPACAWKTESLTSSNQPTNSAAI
ncbi:DoxX family protein [Hymenobacter glaciei]